MVDTNTPSRNTGIATPETLKLQKSLAAGRTVIGVYVGSTSVNVAQTAMLRGKPALIKVAVENIVPIGDEERALAGVRALKTALAGFDTRKAEIVCVIPGRQVLTENILMPLMPSNEMAEAVRLEVVNSQDFVVEDPVFDFYTAGRVIDNGVEKVSVITAAVSKTVVQNLLAPLAAPFGAFGELTSPGWKSASAGVDVAAILPSSVAFENLIRLSPQYVKEIVAVVEIGMIATELNIYRDGRIDFSRLIPVSGFDFTRSLTGALFTDKGKVALSIKEAEEIKEVYGIPSADDHTLISGKITAAQALALLQPKLEQFAGEIYRSFDHYRQKAQARKADRLIICGGGSRLKGLAGFLTLELGLPVQMGDPLQDIAVIGGGLVRAEDVQRLPLAVGASLWDRKGINLLPPAQRDRKKKALVFMLGGTLAAVLLYGQYWHAKTAGLASGGPGTEQY